MSKKVMLCYGTRPEAIKMAPLALQLGESARLEPIIVETGQHPDMVAQVDEVFGITPHFDLRIHKPGQTLHDLTEAIMRMMPELIRSTDASAVVVQGDTTSAFASALAAFYCEIPVVHLEAGLRTGNLAQPFPEEGNRRLIAQVSRLHLAATPQAQTNLLAEGFSPADVCVTGNTVIDALHHVVSQQDVSNTAEVEWSRSYDKLVLVTIHRRESWGEPMRHALSAVRALALERPTLGFILPVHPNPQVGALVRELLEDLPNVLLTGPLGYRQFSAVLNACDVVLTDSGGVQEEAPSLGKPVLVMRETTERPEAVTAGVARLVGTNQNRIISEISTLLDDHQAYQEMARAINPYGDGQASRRVVAAIGDMLGVGRRLPDYVPANSGNLDETLVFDPITSSGLSFG